MNYPFNINIRTAQDSDVEPIVQGNFRKSDDVLQYEIYAFPPYENYQLYCVAVLVLGTCTYSCRVT